MENSKNAIKEQLIEQIKSIDNPKMLENLMRLVEEYKNFYS